MDRKPPLQEPSRIDRRALLVGGALLAAGCGNSPRNESVRSAAESYSHGSSYQRFAVGLDYTHRALRRNVSAIAALAEKDAPVTDAVLDFVGLFRRFLTSHHEGEDRFVFPAIRASTRCRSTDIAFLDAKDREHRDVHRLLEDLDSQTEVVRRASKRSLAKIAETTRSLEALLLPHLESEERALTPENLSVMIEADSLKKAEDAMLEHDKEGGAPLLMLYVHSLTDDEQQILLGSEPWFFRKVLVKGLWKSSFARFVPFAFNPDVAL